MDYQTVGYNRYYTETARHKKRGGMYDRWPDELSCRKTEAICWQ